MSNRLFHLLSDPNTAPDVLEGALLSADTERLQEILNTSIRHGYVEYVKRLSSHIDVTHNKCEAFRWAVTCRQIECARMLLPKICPNLPRGHLYVEDILLNKEQTLHAHKEELLNLCTQVFDMKDDCSHALRSAVILSTQKRETRYAIDILLPYSDVRVALELLKNQRIPSSGYQTVVQSLEYLQSRLEHNTLIEHIDVPTTVSARKI